jgi:hypothetical protein
LEHLKGLTELWRLQLANTAVTDAAMTNIENLTELRELNLTRTRVTDVGVTNLHKALPNCDIDH